MTVSATCVAEQDDDAVGHREHVRHTWLTSTTLACSRRRDQLSTSATCRMLMAAWVSQSAPIGCRSPRAGNGDCCERPPDHVAHEIARPGTRLAP